jgi:hypothetical protein
MPCNCPNSSKTSRILFLGGKTHKRRKSSLKTNKKHLKRQTKNKYYSKRGSRYNRKSKYNRIVGGSSLLGDNITNVRNLTSNMVGSPTISNNEYEHPINNVTNYAV